MTFDRHGPLAEQPPAAALGEEGQHPYPGFRVIHPEVRPGVAGQSDLDADVRALQVRERVLVGRVVAEEDDRAGRLLGAQLVDGGALVGGHHRQFDDLLAGGQEHPGPGGRTRAQGFHDPGGDVAIGSPGVHRHAGRLLLEAYPCLAVRQGPDLAAEPGTQVGQLGRDPLDEADVELGAVAADQVHLAGQPGQRGQITQRSPGDDRDRGLRKRGQGTDRGDCLRQRGGMRGIVHNGRERAVVVARHQ